MERWLREAMILAIWEGPPHRQILDSIEAMERKGALRRLFEHLAPGTDVRELGEMVRRVESHLTLASDQREAHSEAIFRDLAKFAGKALAMKHRLSQGK